MRIDCAPIIIFNAGSKISYNPRSMEKNVVQIAAAEKVECKQIDPAPPDGGPDLKHSNWSESSDKAQRKEPAERNKSNAVAVGHEEKSCPTYDDVHVEWPDRVIKRTAFDEKQQKAYP